ncbi:MAG: glycosyltransferase [Flavobacteriales bacterium]|jgi:glycosyltransferase involved in cell wall biosynthesis|nr:glycosyltransferase [Flavobacteriales bacterium]
MKFSIIIPTYNRANFIEKTILSALNQSYTDFEVVVVDDGSTDHTETIIKKINSNKVKYYFKENGERGAARNYGVQYAIGDYITFLDSDDLLRPNYLEEASQFIQQNNPNVFFQLFDIKNHKGKLIKKAITPPKEVSSALIHEGNIFACQGAFIKKETFNHYLFQEDRKLAGSEDYELWLRMNVNESILCNPVTTSTLIEHDDRSVLNYDIERIIQRKELMLHYLFDDPRTAAFYSPFKKVLYANSYAYISIHLILSKAKKTGFKYYFKALKQRPLLFFSRKSLAILKHLIS